MSEAIPVRVNNITVKERARKELNHVQALAESIRRVGLLHPIVVNSRFELIAGSRRLEAVKRLGWTHVPVRQIGGLDDAISALVAERDENTCREPLRTTEMVALGKRLEALEQPEAAARKAATQAKKNTGKTGGANLAPPEKKGKTREKVAGALGVGHTTYGKAKEVVESGDEELIAEMDETGKVDPAHKKLKEREAEQEQAEDPLSAAAREYTAKINLFVRQLDELQRSGKELAEHPLARCVHWNSILDQLKAARGAAATGRPKFKCPYCKATGQKDGRQCRGCHGQAWVHKTTYKSGCAAVGSPDESGEDADE
jgi:ParB-like chromosome segregation protein Spo0J